MSSYWSHVAKVSGGVIFGQLIGIVGYLLLTWTYSPAAFGVYASWLAVSVLGSVVSTGGLETSLVQDPDGPERHGSAVYMLATVFLGALAYCAATAAVMPFFPNVLKGNFWLISATMFAAVLSLGANAILQSWAAAEGLFRPLTQLRILQSSTIVGFPLALALLGSDSSMLIAGHALGLAVTLIFWMRYFGVASFKTLRLSTLIAFWSKRRRTFVYVLPALVLGSFVGNLPQLAVNARFGHEAAGYMALALRVLGTPISLLGVAVRDVFRRYATLAFRERGECAKEFWNSFLVLGTAAIGFGIVMYLASEPLFVFVFGEEWRNAGKYAQYLVPMTAAGIVASPLTYLVYIVRREDFDFYWQFAILLTIGTVFMAFSDIETTLMFYSLVYTIMYAVYMAACSRFAAGKGLVSGVTQTNSR